MKKMCLYIKEDTVLYGFNNGGMRLEPLIYVEEDAQHKLPSLFIKKLYFMQLIIKL